MLGDKVRVMTGVPTNNHPTATNHRQTLVVIGTDCTDSHKSKHHANTTTTDPIYGVKKELSRETGYICYTRKRKTHQKHTTICVGHHYT